MISFNLITNPRVAGWMTRVFAMKVAGSPAPTLAPEVAPSIDVNQQDDPTIRFLRAERMMGNVFSVSASVGNSGKIVIRNPVTSGVLLVIQGFNVFSATSVNIGVGLQTTDEANIRQAQPRDARWFAVGGTRGAAIISDGATAAPSSFSQVVINANTLDWTEVEFVVPPGAAFTITANAANLQVVSSIVWYEKPTQSEELSLG